MERGGIVRCRRLRDLYDVAKLGDLKLPTADPESSLRSSRDVASFHSAPLPTAFN